MAAAYAAAAEIARLLGWEVGGWKIAANRPAMQAALRADAPIIGRVFKQFIGAAPDVIDHASLVRPIVEPEIVARLAEPLPPRAEPYAEAEVAAAVGGLFLGIETAECRFQHDDRFPALTAIVADGSGSGRLTIGPAIPDWQAVDFAAVDVSVRVDGVEKRDGNVAEAIGRPTEPLTWLANALSRQGLGLEAGDVVSTGTCAGMLRAPASAIVRATFGDLGDVEIRYA